MGARRRGLSKLLVCFLARVVLSIIAVVPANATLVPQPKLPTTPHELAEYHFYLAQTYEAWGWLGRAHLHYEIVHDCYRGSNMYEEASRRMNKLRCVPRIAASASGTLEGIPGTFLSGGSNSFMDRDRSADFDAPSLNPQTTKNIDRLWPAQEKKSLYDELQRAQLTGWNRHSDRCAEYDPSLLKSVPFKEGGFQLLDSPFYGYSKKEPENRHQPLYRFGPSYDGPPLVF